MSDHYGFFTSKENCMMGSIQGVYLTSSTTPGHMTMKRKDIKGDGTYMYKDNIRQCLALFCVRSIPKHNWINSNDVYIANKENINE